MRKLNSLMLMTIVILTTAMSSCKEEKKSTAIDKTDMDLSVNPASDFDNYANGGWKVKNPLPDDKSRFGTFDKLRDVAEKQQQALFDKVPTEKHEQGTVRQKIADLYNMGMDSATIEKQGAAPLKPYLDEIAAIKNIADVQSVITNQHASGNGTLFSFYGS